MTARITYSGVNVDFEIKYDTFDVRYVQERSENRSGSGKPETIIFNSRMEIQFSIILTAAQYRQMIPFFSWARQGYEFAFSVDNTLTASTTLDDTAASGQKTIPLTATTGLTAGDYCLIRAEDNDDEFEIVEIATVNAGVSVVAVDNLVYGYQSADVFRHWRYWPTARLINTNFNPIEMGGAGYYQFAFNIEEVDMPTARRVGPGNWGPPVTLTISSGVLAVPCSGYYLVETEGAASTDDLDQITGLSSGEAVILRPVSDARTVVVKDGTYIKCQAGMDFSMNSQYDSMELICVGSDTCIERTRVDND